MLDAALNPQPSNNPANIPDAVTLPPAPGTIVTRIAPQPDYAPLATALKSVFQALTPWIRAQAGNPDLVEIKPDGSKVTNVDKGIERELQLAAAAALPQALFVGEESWEQLGLDPAAAAGFDRLIVVDPIDGTSHFIKGDASGFASALGVWRKTANGFEHEFGAVFCADDNCLYYGSNANVHRFDLTTGADTQFLPPLPSISNQVIFSSCKDDNGIATFNTANHTVAHLTGAASVPDIMAMIRGQGHACVTRGKLWDVAGAVALARSLGYSVFSPRTKSELTALELCAPGQGRTWELSEPVLLCRPEQAAAVLGCL